MNAVATRRVPVALAFLIAMLFVVVVGQPAHANQTHLSAVVQGGGGSYTFPTAFTNLQTSYVSIYEDNSLSDWKLYRSGASSPFAATGGVYHSWSNFCKIGSNCNSPSGLQIPRTTFYVAVWSYQGVADTVTGDLRWNIAV